VRDYFIHNALYWLTEFHCDGLRFDAVHAILDDSPTHILAELAQRVHTALPGRAIHLVLENEHNEASWLKRAPDGEATLYSAQWNDDVHHVLHVAATADSEGYYDDYLAVRGCSAEHSLKVSPSRANRCPIGGRRAGSRVPSYRPARSLPSCRITIRLAIGPGERITALASQSAIRAVTAIYLLLPQIPMLFMGEEWQCPQPFSSFAISTTNWCECVAGTASRVCAIPGVPR